MSYADITFKDKNRIKRWLQLQRLVSAMKLAGDLSHPNEAVCDFGAGNGELCKRLAATCRHARIICYDPAPNLLSEAKENLKGVAGIEFCNDASLLEPDTMDVVFCLEVFEHLPPVETTRTLETIHQLVKPGGTVVIGVPVEIGIPALYKGIFRMTRRFGKFDATPWNVLSSCALHPPTNRPISEIAPGVRFHYAHTGFDCRCFKRTLARYFALRKTSASPFSALGFRLMPEVYFMASKANGSHG